VPIARPSHDHRREHLRVGAGADELGDVADSGRHVGVGEDVLVVQDAAAEDRFLQVGRLGRGEQRREPFSRRPAVRREMHELIVAEEEDALLRAREQVRAPLEDLLEHGCAVGDRAADHAQHLRGRGLLLERFLGLVEEARVLDRDHGLVGEGLEQGDLARQERARLLTRDDDRADAAIVEQQGSEENRLPSPLASIAVTSPGGNIGIVDVGIVHDPTLGHRERRRALRTGRERRHRSERFTTGPLEGREVDQSIGAEEVDRGPGPWEQAQAALGDLLEHRRGVGDRRADHAQDLGRRRLLLERFGQLRRALLDLALEAGIRLAQLRAHPVELLGQSFELVAGADLDVALEIAGADLRRAFLQRAQRPDQGAGEKEARRDRNQERQHEEERGSLQGRIERRERLGTRRLDEHRPAQPLDWRVRGENLLALEVTRVRRRHTARTKQRSDLRQCAEV
jgi:hypothetical protein